ncbi:NAD(P)H-hydrate epimerase [Ornithinibacillus halophilus]|uniref:NAD(P)H-hydrate epimerase n=1 Tax=Ornithinibacillus halophilus TaxID=930117 RepID=UPI00093369F8|nr:NAD(P)H-hydrate epimerase [Ornithinibacillus halophilus]
MKDELREPITSIVSLIKKAASYVISVDIPSGLQADEGFISFQAVQADYTVVHWCCKDERLSNTYISILW